MAPEVIHGFVVAGSAMALGVPFLFALFWGNE